MLGERYSLGKTWVASASSKLTERRATSSPGSNAVSWWRQKSCWLMLFTTSNYPEAKHLWCEPGTHHHSLEAGMHELFWRMLTHLKTNPMYFFAEFLNGQFTSKQRIHNFLLKHYGYYPCRSFDVGNIFFIPYYWAEGSVHLPMDDRLIFLHASYCAVIQKHNTPIGYNIKTIYPVLHWSLSCHLNVS